MNPISRLLYLWKRKDRDKEIRISLLFYTCLSLIIVVDFIFGYIFFFESKIMFVVDIICLLINLYINSMFERNKRVLGVYTLLGELLVFLIFATLTMGWHYGFQQYIYGMLCIFFLPFYVTDDRKNTRLHIAIVSFTFVFTYYVLDYICNVSSLAPGVENPVFSPNFVFALNSFVSIAAVCSFCMLSTMINNEETKKLRRKADYDELTNIYNRYGLNELLSEFKINEDNVYLAVLDIDFFKKVNDTYGHNAGDEVLKKVASKIKELTKEGIKVGRWGGEEFIIISSPNMSHSEFKKHLEGLRKYFENKTFNIENNTINVTLSMGIGKFDYSKSVEDNIKKADDNLYKAKESGRNRIIG